MVRARPTRTTPSNTGRRLKHLDNLIHHSIKIVPHLSGPETQHPKTVARKHTVAHEVMLGLPVVSVLESIDLDHDPPVNADEVEEVAAEGRLPPHMEPTGAQPLQPAPECDLWLAHRVAEFTGAGNFGAHRDMMFSFCSVYKRVLGQFEI